MRGEDRSAVEQWRNFWKICAPKAVFASHYDLAVIRKSARKQNLLAVTPFRILELMVFRLTTSVIEKGVTFRSDSFW